MVNQKKNFVKMAGVDSKKIIDEVHGGNLAESKAQILKSAPDRLSGLEIYLEKLEMKQKMGTTFSIIDNNEILEKEIEHTKSQITKILMEIEDNRK